MLLAECLGLLGFCRASIGYMDCIYNILFYVLESLGLGLTLEMVWHIQVSRVHEVADGCICRTCRTKQVSVSMEAFKIRADEWHDVPVEPLLTQQ